MKVLFMGLHICFARFGPILVKSIRCVCCDVVVAWFVFSLNKYYFDNGGTDIKKNYQIKLHCINQP